MIRALRALPTACLLALAACSSTPKDAPPGPPAYPELRAAEFGGMQNVAQCGQVWLGSAPTRGDLELAARRGVRTVIDLSAPTEQLDYDVAAVCRELGLRYESPDLEGDGRLTSEHVDRFLDEMVRGMGAPVLVFCGDGSRSSMLYAIHRVLYEGVPLDEALADARRGGMTPGEQETFVREQVQRLL